MASELNGLFNSLTWNDYPERNGPAPGAGQIVVAAFTDAKHTVSPRSALIPGTRKVRLVEATVRIFLEKVTSFKMSWMPTTLPQKDQDDLLDHEQGHYDIHALLTRDLFLDIMKLKSKEYPGSAAVTADILALQRATTDKSKDVQKKYDTETDSGRKPTEQAKWKRFISTAFNTPASPAEFAADARATPIKVRLLSVLAQNGFVF